MQYCTFMCSGLKNDGIEKYTDVVNETMTFVFTVTDLGGVIGRLTCMNDLIR